MEISIVMTRVLWDFQFSWQWRF